MYLFTQNLRFGYYAIRLFCSLLFRTTQKIGTSIIPLLILSTTACGITAIMEPVCRYVSIIIQRSIKSYCNLYEKGGLFCFEEGPHLNSLILDGDNGIRSRLCHRSHIYNFSFITVRQ